MARSGGTYQYNPETGREELVQGSQTAMPSIAERRVAREAALTAPEPAPRRPARPKETTTRRDRATTGKE